MYVYNTTEGGPCVMRPIPANAWDAPTSGQYVDLDCANVQGYGPKALCVGETSNQCSNASCENGIVRGGKLASVSDKAEGPWSEDLSKSEKKQRHNQGWSNAFAFPWEIGMAWNLTVGGVGQRAMGCPGLNEDFGTVSKPNWPYRNLNSPIFGSPAMDCPKNDYAPEGRSLFDIINELAEDNEYFAEKFLEAWQQMTSNGYSDADLVDGPQNGWLGHYSLSLQGVDISDFENYIAKNAPVIFTDPSVSRNDNNLLNIWIFLLIFHIRLILGSVVIEDIHIHHADSDSLNTFKLQMIMVAVAVDMLEPSKDFVLL